MANEQTEVEMRREVKGDLEMGMLKSQSETFKHNYNNLKSIAEKMRMQQEPDIDQLIPMVDSALGSYKICKERLDGVKKLLNDRFGDEESETGRLDN